MVHSYPVLKRYAHAPRSVPHLPNIGHLGWMFQCLWYSDISQMGSSTCGWACRPPYTKSSYKCHKLPRSWHMRCAWASNFSPSVTPWSKWTKERYWVHVRSIVYSNSEPIMQRWRKKDKELIIETLSECADGMWVNWFMFRIPFWMIGQVQMGFLSVGSPTWLYSIKCWMNAQGITIILDLVSPCYSK